MKQLIILFLCLVSYVLKAQPVLTFDDFRQRVLNHHPVIRQASNIAEIGSREVQRAKGQMDPVFQSNIQGKQFDGKEYYNLSQTGLKIPTWVGIDLKTGYERNKGVYLGPEHTTPSSGLWYAGVEIPLGQGLLFDERRATIRQAQVFREMSKNQQVLVINDLMLDATAAYWNWYEAYQKWQAAELGLRFALERFEGVRTNVLLGESPGIDTVEASIQLATRKLERLQAETDFRNTSLLLNLYLWTEDGIPLELDEATIPASKAQPRYARNTLQLRMDQPVQDSIPLLMQAAYKIEQLEYETRWKKEQLKPRVDLSYNPITQPVGNNPVAQFSPENYKFGLSVYVPLLLRKERGALAQVKLKQENAEIDLRYKTVELKNKEEILRNDLYRLYDQVALQQEQIVWLRALRDSEHIRFENGESSLFLVNAREMSYLSGVGKLAELEAKMMVSEAKWLWLFGQL